MYSTKHRMTATPVANERVLGMITSATKFFTVTYTDEYSAGGSSYMDLTITHSDRVVGCGNKRFGTAENGDIALVKASYGKGKKKRDVFCIGVIGKSIPSCHKWFERGGHIWPFNYYFTPITPIIERESINADVVRTCEKTGVKKTCIFNSRFASEKSLKPLLTYMIRNDSIPLM